MQIHSWSTSNVSTVMMVVAIEKTAKPNTVVIIPPIRVIAILGHTVSASLNQMDNIPQKVEENYNTHNCTYQCNGQDVMVTLIKTTIKSSETKTGNDNSTKWDGA